MRARTRNAVTIVIAVATVLGVAFGLGNARRAYHHAVLRGDLARLAEIASTRAHARSRLSISSAPRHVEGRAEAGLSKPLGFYAAAEAVVERASRGESGDSVQADGFTQYYRGDYARAARDFERVANTTPSAAAWSDLAAARLEASRSAVLDVIPALVAIDHALAADPQSPAALYNRAAILERMGLRGHARAAWRVALVAESDSEWRNDIRRHIEDLSFEEDETLGLKALAALRPEKPADVRQVVDRFPQDARLYVESALPVDWAAAVLKGDPVTAETKLKLARAVADTLRDRSGETLAAEAIATIDEAIGGGAALVKALASAYSIYGEGRAHLRAHDYAAAEIQLGEAAKRLARARNPMANVARYNAATAILEQNRVDEAAAQNAAIAREERARPGHRGFAAHLAWQTARTEGIRGHWDAALAAARGAADGFRALGERQYTGFMENMQAEIYDYIGQPERAWTHRLLAFDLLSASGGASRLQVSLGAAARERIRREDWPAAIALLDLEIAQSRRAGQPALLGDALARRARVRAAKGDAAGAREDVAFARAVALRVKDVQERAQVDAAVDVAEAFVEREHDPMNSTLLFTRAIAFYQRTSTILLPKLYLERGRSHLAAGAEMEALADFTSGIERLEQQRATLSDFDFHSTAADAEESLFIEAIRIAVRRGDVEGAYCFSERSRGRALLSALVPGNAPAPARARDGTRVLELMMLPEKLIVFTIDRELRMKEIPLRRTQIEQAVDAFNAKITADASADDVRAAAAGLYDMLLRPLGDVTAGVSTLVFVPGHALERVPWAALYDREQKRYVVENVTVAFAPSVTLYSQIAVGDKVRAHRALIVGNPRFTPAFVDLPDLPGAEEEAKAIARNYAAHTLLLGADATGGRVRREVESCDVLHFGGHAVSSEVSDDQSFLVLAPDANSGDSGILYARDIARLNLRGVSLVVLAACGTIRGTTVHLDGMPSIARSFLAAGTKSVIGTLWDVDDQLSAPLFARIHRDVSAGMPVALALREAQLSAIRNGDPAFAHPKAWGGLMLLGRE